MSVEVGEVSGKQFFIFSFNDRLKGMSMGTTTMKTTMTPTVKLGRTAGGGVPTMKTTLGRVKPTAAMGAGTTTPYIATMPPLHTSCHNSQGVEQGGEEVDTNGRG